MDITEVSKYSGVPASTLRYYEEKGLIKSVGRQGLRRVFKADVIDRLALIALGKNSGFSLDEILTIFTYGGVPELDRQLLIDKADELDQQIRHLSAVRDGLRHAAKCPEDSHLDCPKFRRLMGLASKKNARQLSGRQSSGRQSSGRDRRGVFSK